MILALVFSKVSDPKSCKDRTPQLFFAHGGGAAEEKKNHDRVGKRVPDDALAAELGRLNHDLERTPRLGRLAVTAADGGRRPQEKDKLSDKPTVRCRASAGRPTLESECARAVRGKVCVCVHARRHVCV